MMSISMISLRWMPTDVHIDDLVAVNAHNAVADAVFQEPHRLVAELRRKHPVRHRRRAAALDVSDIGGTHRIGGVLLQLLGKILRADGAFGDDDNVGVLAVGARTVDAMLECLPLARERLMRMTMSSMS